MKGQIKIKKASAPLFDDDGNPSGSGEVFGVSIPCSYQSATKNDVVDVGNGTFAQASYIITVKDMSIVGTQIQLINSRDVVVCKKDIKSLEVLERIKRIKIII